MVLLEPTRFKYLLADFLTNFSAFLHTFELNGLRSCRENQEVAKLACGWNQLVISGGDRHGREPNANVNLTDANSMEEFVDEVRVGRTSNVLFMPQYADPLAMRFFHTFLDVIREYPEYADGSKSWDDRTFPSRCGRRVEAGFNPMEEAAGADCKPVSTGFSPGARNCTEPVAKSGQQ